MGEEEGGEKEGGEDKGGEEKWTEEENLDNGEAGLVEVH